jgi:hypothetical protein
VNGLATADWPSLQHASRIIMLRNYSLLALLVTALPLFMLACGDDDSANDDAKTPATCPAICEQQNNLCNTKNDCGIQCSVLSAVIAKTGCNKEFQEGLDCLAAKNVCDEQETACPATSFGACVEIFCGANATDPICAP